ncbi:hypothetical protein EYF80_040299 [Liparis tanakae]|uniref:Uncharacterized protein n=1 Tax=Liparis tanakae TaxID=230148 RepID=A0A4Z2G902_9TELE|nr:hypothetical protein EYF80_040299 [Liparis tanakae]
MYSGTEETMHFLGLQETIPRKPSRLTSFMGRLLLDHAVSRRPPAQHSSRTEIPRAPKECRLTFGWGGKTKREKRMAVGGPASSPGSLQIHSAPHMVWISTAEPHK